MAGACPIDPAAAIVQTDEPRPDCENGTRVRARVAWQPPEVRPDGDGVRHGFVMTTRAIVSRRDQ